ncbi:MAG: phosphatidate cytidylyltransferase [Pseudomonadota bacterium]
MSNLQQRIISGICMAAVFLVAAYFGGWVFTALMAFVSLVVWAEWSDIAISDGDDRSILVGYIAICALLACLLLLTGTQQIVGLLVVLAVAIGTMLSWPGGPPSVTGLLYAGGFLVAMSQLRNGGSDHNGIFALLFLCAAVWSTDIGAYFAGRAIGGPKLAPKISPNKTISGALGGVLAAMIISGLIVGVLGDGNLTIYLILAAFLSVISQIGDLYESWMKRQAGVKDSGAIIPGHGGAMDRVDGLVFAAISLWVVSGLYDTLFAHS